MSPVPTRRSAERSAVALAWLLLPLSVGLSAPVAAFWLRGRGAWAQEHARNLLLFAGGTAGLALLTLLVQAGLALTSPAATAARLAAAFATVLVLACGGVAPVVVAMSVVEGGAVAVPPRAAPTFARRPVVRMRAPRIPTPPND